MHAWIRASRIVASLLLVFMVWNEVATDSMIGNIDAEAAIEPAGHPIMTTRSARPPNEYPDVLVARALPVPSPTRPAPSPTPAPVPTAQTPEIETLGKFKVTGYSDSPRNGTDGRGITKSGHPTRWGVVAVDPRVIPLGSHLQIDGMGDTEFEALDTGGGIVGRWVDVWFGNDTEALHHGVQYLTVRLIRAQ